MLLMTTLEVQAGTMSISLQTTTQHPRDLLSTSQNKDLWRFSQAQKPLRKVLLVFGSKVISSWQTIWAKNCSSVLISQIWLTSLCQTSISKLIRIPLLFSRVVWPIGFNCQLQVNLSTGQYPWWSTRRTRMPRTLPKHLSMFKSQWERTVTFSSLRFHAKFTIWLLQQKKWASKISRSTGILSSLPTSLIWGSTLASCTKDSISLIFVPR